MIYVDANVIIEIILKRKNYVACKSYLAGAEETLALSTLSLDLVMYYAERNNLQLAPIQQFLRTFVWLPISEADANWAFTHFNGDDYEDGLQVGCAVREQCSRIVTLDRGLAKKYASLLSIVLLP